MNEKSVLQTSQSSLLSSDTPLSGCPSASKHLRFKSHSCNVTTRYTSNASQSEITLPIGPIHFIWRQMERVGARRERVKDDVRKVTEGVKEKEKKVARVGSRRKDERGFHDGSFSQAWWKRVTWEDDRRYTLIRQTPRETRTTRVNWWSTNVGFNGG